MREDRRETGALGVGGISARSDELEPFRPNAGEDERLKLAALGLRRSELGAKPGEDGNLWECEGSRGEFGPGDGGGGVFAAAWRERRFNEFVRRLASLFVDGREALGAPLLRPGPDSDSLCILAVLSR